MKLASRVLFIFSDFLPINNRVYSGFENFANANEIKMKTQNVLCFGVPVLGAIFLFVFVVFLLLF
jgi:hypothetical protein